LLKFPGGDHDGKRRSSVTEWQCSAGPIIMGDFYSFKGNPGGEKKRKGELEMKNKKKDVKSVVLRHS